MPSIQEYISKNSGRNNKNIKDIKCMISLIIFIIAILQYITIITIYNKLFQYDDVVWYLVILFDN